MVLFLQHIHQVGWSEPEKGDGESDGEGHGDGDGDGNGGVNGEGNDGVNGEGNDGVNGEGNDGSYSGGDGEGDGEGNGGGDGGWASKLFVVLSLLLHCHCAEVVFQSTALFTTVK